MSFRFGQALGTLALSLLSWSAQARDIRVAVVTDGPVVRQKLTAEVVEREIENVAGPGLRIVLPPEKRFAGDYSLDGAAAARIRQSSPPPATGRIAREPSPGTARGRRAECRSCRK